MITSVVSSTITALLYMLCFSFFIKAGGEPGDSGSNHRPAQILFTETHSDDGRFLALQGTIDELLVRQQQLSTENETIKHKIVQLETEQYQQAGERSNTGYSQPEVEAAKNPEQEELDMAYESGFSQRFDDLKNQILYEEYDSVWASEMDASFADVEQRLQNFNMNSTAITSKECRSRSCLVEFSHQGGTDQTLVAAMLAANGAREVVLKHVQEGDIEKTLAIYMR